MGVHVTPSMLAANEHFVRARPPFTEKGAASAVGNFCQESGEFLITTMFRARPDASGGRAQDDKSGGIAEWLNERPGVGRKANEIAFSERAEIRLGLPKGSLLNDLGTQCDFVIYELQTNPTYAELYHLLTNDTGRSIATLTADFMLIYERPKLGPTAALDNRIAHAEAIYTHAQLVKGARPPAPSVPVPQVPVPQEHEPPAPPPGAPSIPAAWAALVAVELNQLISLQTSYRDEIQTPFDEAITSLQKLGAAPALLQPHAEPTAIIERTHTMLGPNWQTSLSGIGALLGAAAGVIHSISTVQMPDMTQMGVIFAAISAGVGLLQAKDKAVTGGTVPQTQEAATRAKSQPIR